MVLAYAYLIIHTSKTIDEVPEDLREAVIQELFDQGYDQDGNEL